MTTITYPELLTEVKKVRFEQLRVDSQDALEIVMHTDCLRMLYSVLQRYFGPALKPAGKIPTKESQEYTTSVGGIRENQTLYHLKHDGFSYCAMVWPWNDGIFVTVKIFKL